MASQGPRQTGQAGLPSKFASQLLLSPQFVLCAGTILFRFPTDASETLQVCLLYHLRKSEYLLPKGRKDLREGSLGETAIRETYEETGYPCSLLPVTLFTRAPIPRVDIKDNKTGTPVENCCEAFAVTIRHVGEDDVKMIHWYIAQAVGNHEENTQMPSEGFRSCWFGCERAVEMLSFEHDREVARKAIQLVRNSYFSKPLPSYPSRTQPFTSQPAPPSSTALKNVISLSSETHPRSNSLFDGYVEPEASLHSAQALQQQLDGTPSTSTSINPDSSTTTDAAEDTPVIPDLPKGGGQDGWRACLTDWYQPDPDRGMLVPLKDWPREWSTGPYRAKYYQRSLIPREHERLGEEAFLEKYGSSAALGYTALWKAIQQQNPKTQRRKSGANGDVEA